ncbi:hypothetical protein V1525DRAFT_408457 [Lipomyces kononenkoae]|uniref:Uncharacterized protein n=1 Tax=Lipomyces kononenkoae TaxID=34357 RepID=A0ACC3SXA3_LIPKO
MDSIPTRISLQSHLGTLRYHGSLPVWPNTIALGIEWDDETRGKHSGSYNGVQYFETSVPNSATFVKAGRSFDNKRSFLEALKGRYAPNEVDELEKADITFGHKVVERVGFDKFRKLQAQLDKLSLVALDQQCIAYPSEGLNSFCPRIQDLDLSRNLFDYLLDVAKITIQLPRLRLLRLNGNRIISWELPEEYGHAFEKIEVISLSSTLIPLESISRLPKYFPAARECSLAENYITSAEINFSVEWQSLESLDLSYNQFTTIPSITFPDGATSPIKSLNLSHNSISEIQSKSTTHTTTLRAVDLRHNNLNSWKDVDALASQFTTVTDARIQWNPFADGVADDDLLLAVVARWASLTSLNGMKVSQRERMNAEIYFMAKAVKTQIPEFDLDCPRWKQLCDIYGPPVISEVLKKSTLLTITFVFNGEENRSKQVPRGLSVQKLRILVAKWYEIPAAFVELALIDDDGTELKFEDSLRQIEYYGVDEDSTIKITEKR